jgi:hypothetical protein
MDTVPKHKSIFLRIQEICVTYLVLCLFFLYSFLTHLTGLGYSLCFGNDGHVGLEASGGSLCCEPSELDISTIEARRFLSSEKPPFDCCIDIPIDSICNDDELLAKKTPRIPHLMSFPPEAHITGTLSPDILLKNAYFESNPHLNIPLLSFSTVSLLI